MITNLGIDTEVLLLAVTIVVLLLCIIIIVLIVKMSSVSRKYDNFMMGKDAVSLEQSVIEAYRQIDALTAADKERESENAKVLGGMRNTFQKMGLVKYDAFKEMGGKLSFSLALLDASNTGFILSVMHSREACYTYIKEIIKGESYIALGDEEKEALEKAIYDER